MSNKQWELQRMGILRHSHYYQDYQVVTPAGGFYEMDRRSVELLLQMHGKLVGSNIKDYTRREIEEFTIFAEREHLLKRKPLTDYIEAPFDIQQIKNNLDKESIEMLTLGDLALQITNNCNYRCKGCSSDASLGQTTKLTDVDFKQVIQDASRFGCLTLGLTGGEPILPGIITEVCHLIKTARCHNFQKVIIATNGFYVKRFIRDLKRAGATRLSISFHGFDGYMENYTGCTQASAKSEEAIQACLNEGLHLGINCVLTRENLSQMDRIVEKFYPIIADTLHAYLRFSPLLEIGRANRCYNLLLDSNDMAAILKNVANYKRFYGEKIRLTCDEEYEPDDPMICDAGLMYTLVNKNGSVSACDILENHWSMGNVKQETFFDIWNDNARWYEFRQVIPINERCASCPPYKSKMCFGKCKALSYLRFGSALMSQLPDERRCLR